MEENAFTEQVVLVDADDNPIGLCPKLEAHQNGGRLHRALSVFVLDSRGRMLLQRRSTRKYHFGGLWTNACCSHPRDKEDVLTAAHRRLKEEFGFDTDLRKIFHFTYKAHDRVTGLTEHEYDHVFFGQSDALPAPDPDEIDDWMWIDVAGLKHRLHAEPSHFTPWFGIALATGIDNFSALLR